MPTASNCPGVAERSRHSGEKTDLLRYCGVIVSLVLVFTDVQAQSGAWTRKKDMPTGRATPCAAVVNNKIYVIGGVDKDVVSLANCEVYDPSADTWEEKKALPAPRGFISTGAVNGIIYAIGGRYMGAGTSEVLAYDPVADTGWTPKEQLLSPRFGAAAGVVDGIIYNVGGNHTERNCEAYNSATNTWIRKADIPETFGGIAVAPCGGLLYGIGGGFSTVFQTVYAYDPKTDGWTKKADMPTARGWSHPAPVVDGRIYVVGGYKRVYGEVLSDVEVYDPVLDNWSKKPDMPFIRTMFAAAVVNGKIYIIGGTTDFSSVEKDVWEYDPAFHTDIAAGSVSGTWTLDGSPYHISGEITVPNDSTLTIEPGVEVVFLGHYKLNVQGRLLAVGTKVDSIRFTAENKGTGWHGIRFVGTPGTNDTSRIAYCVFKHGRANTGSDEYGLDRCGGAILISQCDKVVVSDCFFQDNHSDGEKYATGGAGIFIDKASPTVRNNTFQGNTSSADCAIKCVYASTAIISNNVISHSNGVWEAIVCGHSADNRPIVSGNIITNNSAPSGGAGIAFWTISNARIENNVIVHNSGQYGGIICYNCGSPTIINNTIAYNTASTWGGGLTCVNSSPILINNILYGNSAPAGREVNLDYDGSRGSGSAPVFLHCDIQGGKKGFAGVSAGRELYEHNIDADPLFINAASDDYRLSDSSRCIGAGTDSIGIAGVWFNAPLFCMKGNPRPSPAGSRPDIGACEHLLPSPLVAVSEEFTTPKEYVLHQNYPNPFNPSTTFTFELPRASKVTLSVSDILGREVSVLVNDRRDAGVYEVTFDGSNLASGVYIYRLTAGDIVLSKKCAIVK